MGASLPLTDEELDGLDGFLLDHPDDTLPLLSELDGLLTAMAIFPGLVPREEWLEALFGKDMPCFETVEQRAEFVGVVSRRHAEIQESLRAQPPTFLPILDEDIDGGVFGEIWAAGFKRGMAMRPDSWTSLWESDAGAAVLLPIMALADPEFLAMVEPRKRNRGRKAQDYSENIFAYVPAAWRLAGMTDLERIEAWAELKQYDEEARLEREAESAIAAARRGAGRNDPCPCGSGKKFKRCCGSAQA